MNGFWWSVSLFEIQLFPPLCPDSPKFKNHTEFRNCFLRFNFPAAFFSSLIITNWCRYLLRVTHIFLSVLPNGVVMKFRNNRFCVWDTEYPRRHSLLFGATWPSCGRPSLSFLDSLDTVLCTVLRWEFSKVFLMPFAVARAVRFDSQKCTTVRVCIPPTFKM